MERVLKARVVTWTVMVDIVVAGCGEKVLLSGCGDTPCLSHMDYCDCLAML